MFGFTEESFDLYKKAVTHTILEEVLPSLMDRTSFIAPADKGMKAQNNVVAMGIFMDIQLITALAASQIAYDYASMQDEGDKSEEEILEMLHIKYLDYVEKNLVQEGVCFSVDAPTEIVGDILLELPYIYADYNTSEGFDQLTYLEERAESYNNYVGKYLCYNDEEILEEGLDEDEEGDY